MTTTRRRIDIPDGLAAGVGLAFGTALISGVSIFVNAAGVRQVPDAAVYTTAKNLVAAVALVALLLATGGQRTVARLDRRSVAGLGLVAVVGGSVPFVLFFSGLAIASAPTAAFIQKTLFVWVALLAVPFLGERLGSIQVVALAVLLVGQSVLAAPTGVRWGTGETMIAAATLLWAVEVVLARRLLAVVDSTLLGTARMGLGVLLLLGYLAVSGRMGTFISMTAGQWAWVVGTGLLLGAYVATWLAALRRAPATTVTAVLVSGALVTATLSAIQQGAPPAPTTVGANVLILLGAVAIAALALRPSAGTAGAIAAPPMESAGDPSRR